jgi:hypothetical protein
MNAFHGDIELKNRLRGRLEADLARRAIEGGETAWHDDRGSLAGSLLRGTNLKDGPAGIGIPEPVLALLDHFGSRSYDGLVPIDGLARRFMDAARPGADLSGVPAALIERMGEAFGDRLQKTQDAPEYVRELAVLIETRDGSSDHLKAVFDQWLDVRSREARQAIGWSDEQETQAQETLNRLWDETEGQRRAGQYPNYPDLFARTDPDLAAGYRRGLEALNQSYDADTASLVDWFIDLVRAA